MTQTDGGLWGRLRPVLPRRGVHGARVENAVGTGTPDVWLRTEAFGAWLELKYSKAWPKRSTTLVRLRHFSTDQRRWLVREGAAGGHAGVLWQIDNEYLLFGWWHAPQLGQCTRAELYELALWHDTTLAWQPLKAGLCRCRKSIGNRQ